jgi:hypothetical protein
MDIDRMAKALAQPSIKVPTGLTREQTRSLFLKHGQPAPGTVVKEIWQAYKSLVGNDGFYYGSSIHHSKSECEQAHANDRTFIEARLISRHEEYHV